MLESLKTYFIQKSEQEEFRLKFIAILKTEPSLRLKDDIDLVERMVEGNQFLGQFKGTKKLKDLCREM